MSKTVVLLGASGLLGSEILQVLRAGGWNVHAPTHSELDIADAAAVMHFFANHAPEYVINAAALIDMDAIEADPLPAWQVNALGAGAVARALWQNDRKETSLIHISSNYVFGDAQEQYQEEDLPQPMQAYGQTKMLGEALVQKYCSMGDIKFSIIRTSWLYSALRETFVDAVAKTLLRGQTFQASPDQFGNLTSAADLANVIGSQYMQMPPSSGMYHLVNHVEAPCGGVSRYEIAVCVAQALDLPSSLIEKNSAPVPFVAKRPAHAVLINTKSSSLPGWEESLRSYIRSVYMPAA